MDLEDNFKEDRSKGSVYKQCIVSCVASTISFTYGLQTGWLSPMIPLLKEPNNTRYIADEPLTSEQITLLGSTMPVVACIFSMAYSHIADKFGRKIALMLIAAFQSVGFMVRLFPPHIVTLTLSQVFCGLGGAGVFSIVPTYTKEVSQDSMRGILGSVIMLIESLGIFAMYFIGNCFEYALINKIVLFVPLLNVITLFFIPESPAFLVKNNKIEEAAKVTANLRGKCQDDKSIQLEILMLKNQVAICENAKGLSLGSLVTNKLTRKTICLATLVLSVVDAGGNYALFTYASTIMKKSGVYRFPELQTVLFPVVMILGSLLSTVTVEKFGRKPLLITGLVVNALALGALATSQLTYYIVSSIPQWLPTLCIIASVFTYGADLPIPFVVISEITDLRLRAKLLGYLGSYGWFLCLLQSASFLPISKLFGIHTVFFVYSALNVSGALSCYFLLNETKGKTLEQIENEMMRRK